MCVKRSAYTQPWIGTSVWKTVKPAILILSVVLCLNACGRSSPVSEVADFPTPTIPALFQEPPTRTALLPEPTRTAQPAPTVPAASMTQTAVPSDANLVAIPIYDDRLREGWSLEPSFRMVYDVQHDSFVNRGSYAIEAQAEDPFASLYFTIQEDSGQVFLRDRVLGLRFLLSGGESEIGNQQLAVSVVGSDAQPYWLADDNSVAPSPNTTIDAPLFSETRLAFLSINVVPVGEWVEVVVWLDELIYDPYYTYVTGFYLKTDELPRFYIDQVELIVLDEI
jgi:hypothetical protein